MRLYKKLAFEGIKKGRDHYIPFIVTVVINVIILYCLLALFASPIVKESKLNFSLMLKIAINLTKIISIIFVVYTASFLNKLREKLYSVYSVLGLDKKGLITINLIEILILYVISITVGLLLAMILFKIPEGIFFRMVNLNTNFNFLPSLPALLDTAIHFLVIFGIIFLFNTIRLSFKKTIDLVNGEKKGEKLPKNNPIYLFIALVTLGAGYYLANNKIYLANLLLDIVLVIIGTYFAFIEITTLILKLLKNNKRFYYRTDHFTSVSGLIFRLKQNAVGLATICIFTCAVVVLLSTTSALFIGVDDMVSQNFPYDYIIQYSDKTEEISSEHRDLVEDALKKNGITMQDEEKHDYLVGLLAYKDKSLARVEDYSMDSVYIIKKSDYTKGAAFKDEDLQIYGKKSADEEIFVGDKTYKAKFIDERLQFVPNRGGSVMTLVVKDEIYNDFREIGGYKLDAASILTFNNKADDPNEVLKIINGVKLPQEKKDKTDGSIISAKANEVKEIYSLYGSVAFVGVVLSFLFMVFAVLVVYYKQLSEGFEDRKNFQILSKVGLTDREIKKTINKQIMTVFSLPITVAAIHMIAAYKLLNKFVITLGVVSSSLYLKCLVISFIVFTIFYLITYKITSKIYYKQIS